MGWVRERRIETERAARGGTAPDELASSPQKAPAEAVPGLVLK